MGFDTLIQTFIDAIITIILEALRVQFGAIIDLIDAIHTLTM